MPSCIANGCSNTSGRVLVRKSFFQVPKPVNEAEKQRAARWLYNIGTGHNVKKFQFTRNKVVCEDHFHDDCFEINRQAILLNITPKCKKLVPGAIPTVFSHRTFDKINMDGTVLTTRESSLKRARKQEAAQLILDLLDEKKNEEKTSGDITVDKPKKIKKVVKSNNISNNEPTEVPIVIDRISADVRKHMEQTSRQASCGVQTEYSQCEVATQTEAVHKSIVENHSLGIDFCAQAPEQYYIAANTYGVSKDHPYFKTTKNKQKTSRKKKKH